MKLLKGLLAATFISSSTLALAGYQVEATGYDSIGRFTIVSCSEADCEFSFSSDDVAWVELIQDRTDGSYCGGDNWNYHFNIDGYLELGAYNQCSGFFRIQHDD